MRCSRLGPGALMARFLLLAAAAGLVACQEQGSIFVAPSTDLPPSRIARGEAGAAAAPSWTLSPVIRVLPTKDRVLRARASSGGSAALDRGGSPTALGTSAAGSGGAPGAMGAASAVQDIGRWACAPPQCCSCSSYDFESAAGSLTPKSLARLNKSATARPAPKRAAPVNANPASSSPPSVSSGDKANGIVYHGGPVMSANVKVYLIWYGLWEEGQKAIIRDLVNGLSGSDVHGIITTYGDSTGAYARPGVSLGGEYAYPTLVYGTDIRGHTLDLVAAPLDRDIPFTGNDVFMLLTGPDITTSGFDYKNNDIQYCGWHSYATRDGKPVVYAFVPNPSWTRGNGSACGASSPSPNGDPGVDSLVSTLAHELWESLSDGTLGSWYDSKGNENADKCAWKATDFETVLPSGATANTVLGARPFYLQSNWVNWNGGYCGMSASQMATGRLALKPPSLLGLAARMAGPAGVVNCPPSSALAAFHVGTDVSGAALQTFGATLQYLCPPMDFDRISTAQRFVTGADDDGAGNTAYLDRHNVRCPDGTLMQGWRLIRPSSTTLAVEYWCAAISGGTQACRDASTPLQDEGGGNVLYLDRHTVQCQAGEWLQGWQLQRVGSPAQARFAYTCCSPPASR